MLVCITGASSGIGKSTAQLFAAHGHDLIITGRRAERLTDLQKELTEKYKVRIQVLVHDVRNYEETKSAIDALSEEWRDIDLLVNNAGLAAGLSSIQDGDLGHWERMIDTNVKGLLYMTRLVAALMIPRKKGHIINIGSIAGKEVYANGNVYCATKHAVDALSKGMRIDLLPHQIKVTAIHPGMVETEFSVVRFDGDEERAKKVYAGMQPLLPEDIAETIYWAASRPAHVNINDLVIMPAVQANATTVIRH
ncbi:MAG: SDR family NAD(P)-dependent oxidoreductase [Sphingobacteriia bacterium]|jgi:NADP-dependent 3-hydroxy acid dehydrogenase YdfG|nr:SDR family NAD(P)-dependent oxidoreductase [Sphingobacteriia bacterium]